MCRRFGRAERGSHAIDGADICLDCRVFAECVGLRAACRLPGDAPVLIRIETDAGQGAGKPIQKVIEEVADLYAFLARHILPEN